MRIATRAFVLAALVAMVSLLLPTTGAQAQDERPATIRVTFENLTSNQPMTPPVVAIHDADAVQLFSPGQPASAEVQAIAENGNNAPLVALAGTLAEPVLFDAGVVGGAPIFPGGTASADLFTIDPNAELSLVTMVICTNDAFTGINSISLPAAGETTVVDTIVYDAGTEVNVEELEYWVPPCGGGANGNTLREAENGVIRAHPGQSGSPAIVNFGGGPFTAPSADFAPGATVARVYIENLNPPAAGAAASGGAAAPAAPTELAFTGAEDAVLAAIGAAMIGFGALAVGVSRRRES